jgi:hypothetical protein
LQQNVTKLSIASQADSMEWRELLGIPFVEKVNPLIR